MEQTILTKFVVPAALFIVMMGLGLSLTTNDFRRVISSGKPLLIGVIGQMIALPVFAYLLIIGIGLDPIYGLGLMVLALSPGGALSNAIVHIARAELALSVTLTAITSLVTPLTIPLLYSWFASDLTGESAALVLPLGKTMFQLFMISIVPIAIGMVVRLRFLKFALRAERPVKILSVIFFLMVIIGVIKQNWEVFPLGFSIVGPAVIALNLGSLSLGFFGARLARLNLKDSVTIGIEVGMQNVATATFVTATLLGDITMAIPPAIYATVMVPSALIFGLAADRLLSRKK